MSDQAYLKPLSLFALFLALTGGAAEQTEPLRPKKIGRELAVPHHVEDDANASVAELLNHGALLFSANWTDQDGAGRPLSKGTGKQLTDPSQPLTGKRAFNCVSAPDANSCTGCHNMPYGIPGGGGDFVTNVFVLGHRFDFATFDSTDKVPTRGSLDENGEPISPQSVGNFRATTGMFGAGYIEMLARQIAAELQATRDKLKLGETGVRVPSALDRCEPLPWSLHRVTVSVIDCVPYVIGV
jgi:hypothetical protein